MTPTLIEENCIQKIFTQSNWMTLISNKVAVCGDIRALLNSSGNERTSETHINCDSLIGVQSSTKVMVYLKIRSKLRLKMIYQEDTESLIFEPLTASVVFGQQSKSLCFDLRTNIDTLCVISEKSTTPFYKYISLHISSAAKLMNFDSVKQSLEWLTAQEIQKIKVPSPLELKKAS